MLIIFEYSYEPRMSSLKAGFKLFDILSKTDGIFLEDIFNP